MSDIIYKLPLIRTSEAITASTEQDTTTDKQDDSNSSSEDTESTGVLLATRPRTSGTRVFENDSPAHESQRSSPKRSLEIEESESGLQTRSIIEKSKPEHSSQDHDESPRKKFKEKKDTSNDYSYREWHPDYKQYDLRLKTFCSLPRQDKHYSIRMAGAGLFLTENPDIVRCFHCGIVIQEWTTANDALQEHMHGSPQCEFLRASKPQNELQADQAHPGLLQQEYHNIPRIQTPARHPDYLSLQLRLETFSNWPHHQDIQYINRLAQTGLFFTGNHDLVRCFHCGIGLKDWSSADDPLQVHIRHSTNCEFLRATIPQSEIETYRVILSTGKEDPPSHPQQLNVKCRPTYQDYDARISSFSNWPSNITQTPQQLAEAGFFYTGMEDIVRCYACDGGLRRWDSEDDPWIEHAHWFPHCLHVIRKRGHEYIDLIQAVTNDEEENDRRKSEQLEHLYVNKKIGQESDDPIYSAAAQTALDFGFSRAAVKMAIQECNDQSIRWNAEDLVNLLLQKQDNGEVLPSDSPRAYSPALLQKANECGMTKELKQKLKCILCEEEDVNVLFMPCAHHNMCITCAEDVTMCPICGKTVKEKIRTYMS